MSDAVREEQDSLLAFVMPFAERLVSTSGSFHPFAAVLTPGGEIAPVEDVPDEEQPDAQRLLERLVGSIRERAVGQGIRGCAICADVTVTPPGDTRETDAIRVVIEHVEADDAVTVFRPYSRGFRKPRFGPLFALRSPRELLVLP